MHFKRVASSTCLLVALLPCALSAHPSPRPAAVGGALPYINPEGVKQSSDSFTLSKKGDEYAVRLVNARQHYQKALELWNDSPDALYGMAKCCLNTGDVTQATGYYRKAIYGNGRGQPYYREIDTTKLLTYARLLDKAGQTAEAVTVYNHAVSLLKYTDDKPSSVYLLPLFGTDQGQIAYNSSRLQALAQVGLGVFSQDTQELTPAERVAHLRAAARLYPDSPVVQSYLGDVLANAKDEAGAKAARAKANALGISRVTALLDAQTAIMQEQKGVK